MKYDVDLDKPNYDNYDAEITLFLHDLYVQGIPLDMDKVNDFEESVINYTFTDQEKLLLLSRLKLVCNMDQTINNHNKTMAKAQQNTNNFLALIYQKNARSTRRVQRSKKRVTSVAIHDDNQVLIDQLQQEAKKHGFVMSKEFIINSALRCFGKLVASESFFNLMCDILE
jgi:hypothetical protein